MIQQVNLYRAGLRKNRVPFSATQMAAALVTVFFLIVTAGTVSYWRQSSLAAELARLQKRQDAAAQRIDDYQKQYPPRSPDAELVRAVDEMMHAHQAGLKLLRLIDDSQLGNRSGLAGHLTGLARQHLSSVWLRRIRIGAGGEQLLLEGSSTRAADVPLYLQRLKEQDVFAGREFEHLQLSRSDREAQTIDFLLQTIMEDTP